MGDSGDRRLFGWLGRKSQSSGESGGDEHQSGEQELNDPEKRETMAWLATMAAGHVMKRSDRSQERGSGRYPHRESSEAAEQDGRDSADTEDEAEDAAIEVAIFATEDIVDPEFGSDDISLPEDVDARELMKDQAEEWVADLVRASDEMDDDVSIRVEDAVDPELLDEYEDKLDSNDERGPAAKRLAAWNKLVEERDDIAAADNSNLLLSGDDPEGAGGMGQMPVNHIFEDGYMEAQRVAAVWDAERLLKPFLEGADAPTDDIENFGPVSEEPPYDMGPASSDHASAAGVGLMEIGHTFGFDHNQGEADVIEVPAEDDEGIVGGIIETINDSIETLFGENGDEAGEEDPESEEKQKGAIGITAMLGNYYFESDDESESEGESGDGNDKVVKPHSDDHDEPEQGETNAYGDEIPHRDGRDVYRILDSPSDGIEQMVAEAERDEKEEKNACVAIGNADGYIFGFGTEEGEDRPAEDDATVAAHDYDAGGLDGGTPVRAVGEREIGVAQSQGAAVDALAGSWVGDYDGGIPGLAAHPERTADDDDPELHEGMDIQRRTLTDIEGRHVDDLPDYVAVELEENQGLVVEDGVVREMTDEEMQDTWDEEAVRERHESEKRDREDDIGAFYGASADVGAEHGLFAYHGTGQRGELTPGGPTDAVMNEFTLSLVTADGGQWGNEEVITVAGLSREAVTDKIEGEGTVPDTHHHKFVLGTDKSERTAGGNESAGTDTGDDRGGTAEAGGEEFNVIENGDAYTVRTTGRPEEIDNPVAVRRWIRELSDRDGELHLDEGRPEDRTLNEEIHRPSLGDESDVQDEEEVQI